MSRHVQIEEVSDSDPDEMDPSDFTPPPPNRTSNQTIISPSAIPFSSFHRETLQPSIARRANAPQQDADMSKQWHCLYPLYFDANRSRAGGRRVGQDMAVRNPLAREIADAVGGAGLRVAFEPAKTHPKDWANPGRVRCHLKGQAIIKNKHHLYMVVAEYLKSHPTTEMSPLRLPILGMPQPKGVPPGPVIPNGWKMGTVLPLHSPAVTGGGVSDNLFKDMMSEMQGGGGAGPAAGAVEPKKKKEKKKGK